VRPATILQHSIHFVERVSLNSFRSIRQTLNNPFAALKHKSFRYYWLGMCVSLIGTWMQNIAQPWLAYTLTSSAFLLALVSALQFTPMLLFSLFAGAWIDKFPKKSIILFTQSASLVITLAFAVLNSTGVIRYWHILVLAALIGVVNTLDMPTRQAFVIELVGKEDLMNAIALNSSVFNLARIVGPALAGIVMGIWGLTVCFYANAISFGAVIISLLLIKPEHVQDIRQSSGTILRQIGDGLKYVGKTPILLETILSTAIIGTFAFNTSVLVPVFAKEILGQKEAGFGLLMSLMGIGSFLGAISMAFMSKSGPNKATLNILPVVIAIFLALTGITSLFGVTGACLAVLGFSLVWFSATANSTVQIHTEDEYRGRVMSIYTLVFGGLVPIGNLYAGAIANRFGPRIGFAACGLIIAVLYSALMYVCRKTSRRMSGPGCR
jgi:MFS family permease